MNETVEYRDTTEVLSVWFASPDELLDDRVAKAWADMLSADELARLGRFRFGRDRRSYLAAHALVRSALSDYRRCDPRSWLFTASSHGKPAIDPSFGLEFNISHSEKLVACAISASEEVGVDVEAFSRAEDVLEIAPRIFSRDELKHLEGLRGNEKEHYAVKLWTLKEAYSKALGRGLSVSLEQITVLFEEHPPRISVHAPHPTDLNPHSWNFSLLEHEEHSIGVVYCMRNEGRFDIRKMSGAGCNITPLVEPVVTCFPRARSSG